MKRKSIYLIFTMLFCFVLSNCSSYRNIEKNNKINQNNEIQEEIKSTSNYTVTMSDIALFLETRKEHYPLSDEFIERYQQEDGGYIDNALKAGLVVDKLQHEPNQKWHFFESWYYPSLEDGTLTNSESAKSRVYSKLLCPELLLWIYEACNVSPSKVKAAKEVAEESKVNKTHISTMAKNMRAIVPWEDLESTIIDYLNSNIESYKVSIEENSEIEIIGLKDEYKVGSEVAFSINVLNEEKEVNEVKVNNELIKQSAGKYKFIMPSNDVIISVSLKEKEIIIPPETNESSYVYNIKYDLGTRKTAKLLESNEDLLNTFEYQGEGESIIKSISQMEYMYGGAYGGSGDNKWYTGDIIKFGTTSVNGSFTFELTQEVSAVNISGYVSNSSCKVRIGDSNSLDWESAGSDNKTTLITCSSMNVTSKEVVEANQTSDILMEFESTKDLKIAVTNTKPFYITKIEFIVEQ